MPIVPPLLDDRTWQDLRDEALARVPIYTPEWTDLRPGDPGYGVKPPLERGRYEDFYAGVVGWLNGAPQPVDPADSLACLRILEAARRSSETRTVEVL